MASDSEILATGKTYDVFLAHNSADKVLVKKLAELLQKEDLSVFLDSDSLVPGEPWQEGIERGLSQSRTCVVCIGPAGLGPWTREEVGIALSLAVRDFSFLVIPVLLPEAKELEQYKLPASLTLRHSSDLRSGLTESSLQPLVRAIRSAGARVGPDSIVAGGTELRTSGPHWSPAQDRIVEKAYSQEASSELARLRQKVTLSPAEAREESKLLAERVQAGDLQSATSSVKAQVLQLAAQRHAVAETLDLARRFRDNLCQVDPTADTTVIDALILEAEGDADGALRLLRDRKEPEAHNNFFLILNRAKGNALALEWYESQEDRDDPYFFTARGWCNLAIVFTELDRWEDAATRLAHAGKHRSEYADFPYIEGAVNAAFLLPAEFRHLALVTNLFPPEAQEGPDADLRRARATACFREAEEALKTTQPERAFAAREWGLWLRLTHSELEEQKRAKVEVEKDLQNLEQGLRLIPLAQLFQIPFDAEKYWKRLDFRAKTGGLDSKEFHALYVLARERLGPGEFLLFLESEDARLKQLLPNDRIVLDKLDALVRDGQAAKARTLLEQSRGELEEAEYRRVGVILDTQEGRDPRVELEKIYESTHSLIDLQNLTGYLWSIKDWTALRPLLRELLGLDTTLPNLRRLIICTERDSGGTDQEVVDLLESYSALAVRDQDLVAAKARALFHLGRIEEARALNDKLLGERNHSNDLDLDINLALQLGDWERFPGIVEREWARRETHEPVELIRLASLAAETDATASRAFELLKLAAEKGSENPYVLTQAAGLAYRLGREDERPAEWLAKAFALSPQDGPVRMVELRELVEEWMPKHQESRRTAEELWSKGEAPLHLVADHLNIPLSILLADLPRRNAVTEDGRRRTIIPIISGARQPIALQSDWTVGFDISSLMVLAFLGILKEALESFRGVVVASDTMVLLLRERNDVRFHQPSLVERAKEVRRLIDRGRLRIAEVLPEAPAELAEEVGRDLAQLLEEARKTQSRVVRPRPIHKLRTFQGEEADLGDCDSLILSAVGLERLLHEKGLMDATAHERASQYLRSHDRGGDNHVGAAALQGPIFLDDLALAYLQGAGLLPVLESSRLDFRIHPSVKEEQLALIESEHERKSLEDFLEGIRVTLRDALQSGKAKFIQRQGSNEDKDKAAGRFVTAIQFLRDVGPWDAVAIDDRYLQRFGKIVDRTGRGWPVFGVLDILRHLEAQGTVTPGQRYSMLHKLRQAGFAFVPVEAEELLSYLRAMPWKEDDPVIESAELRVVRQTLARIHSLEMLNPMEFPFFAELDRTGSQAIQQVWIDEAISEGRAIWMASWIWNHISPSIWDWVKRSQEEPGEILEAFVQHIALALVQPLVGRERFEAFLNWVQEMVINPLLPGNIEIVDRVAQRMGQLIEAEAKKLQDARMEKQLARELWVRQPLSIRERLFQREPVEELIGISGVHIRPQDLLSTARQASSEIEETVPVIGKGEARIRKKEGGFLLALRRGEMALELPFDVLGLVVEDAAQRVQAFETAVAQIGPTQDVSALRLVVGERPLSDAEAGMVLDLLVNGVATIQGRIEKGLIKGTATLSGLVPESFDYFERFCGPDPGDSNPEEYLVSVLLEYRRTLLERDPRQGLEICLLGALRDDLYPAPWLQGIDNDSLWEHLTAYRPELDPLSLLAALDLALYRQEDERFRSFSEKAVSLLAGDEFLWPNGLDCYQLIPVLASFVLNRIQLMEGGAPRQPFWKRMCAWMQATFLARRMHDSGIDLTGLREIVNRHLLPAGAHANSVDLRREPMVEAGTISPFGLRREILGRLVVLHDRHRAAGRPASGAEGIQQALERLRPVAPPSALLLPGPLDGHLLPRAQGKELPDDLKERLLSLHEDLWLENLAVLSQRFVLPEDLKSALRDMISREIPQNEDDAIEKALTRLWKSGMIAAAERDTKIAESIAAAMLRVASDVPKEEALVWYMVETLLRAAAAFEEESAWGEWLEAQLFGLANRLPEGEMAMLLWQHMQELKKVTRLELGIFRRAEAVASAAASGQW